MQDSLLLIPQRARRYQGEPAGLMTRSIAGTVDAVVVGAALVASYAGLNAVIFIFDPRDFQATRASWEVTLGIALVACVVYLTSAWAGTGRTYGDRLMGLRVVDRHRRRIRLPRALGRALLCVTFPVGLLWSLPSVSRRSVQDVVLRTAVVYDWTSRRSDAEPGLAPQGVGHGDTGRTTR